MDELFYDRFSGKSFDLLPVGRTVLGRWLLRVPPDKDVFLNSVPAQSGEFLVPELSGNWRVLDGGGAVQQGRTTRKLDPEEVEAESIRTMGRHLDDLVGADATWLEWLDVVPLVPGMSDAVDLLPLEQLIRELFGHLEAVCMKPRAHLHVEVERVPVAKARDCRSRRRLISRRTRRTGSGRSSVASCRSVYSPRFGRIRSTSTRIALRLDSSTTSLSTSASEYA